MVATIPGPRIFTGVLALVLAASAQAEVMDKLPTIQEAWRDAIIIGLLALVLARFNPLLGIVTIFLPNAALSLASSISDVWEEAVRAEAGQNFIDQVHWANATTVAFYLLGVALWWKSRASRSQLGFRRRVS